MNTTTIRSSLSTKSRNLRDCYTFTLWCFLAREQRPEATDAAYVSNGNQADYKLVRQDIAELINVNPAKGPTLVRLAWHSSGTYSKILKDGGSSKGTIRFKEELAHGANAGLDTATMWLEPIYKKVSQWNYFRQHDIGLDISSASLRSTSPSEV